MSPLQTRRSGLGDVATALAMASPSGSGDDASSHAEGSGAEGSGEDAAEEGSGEDAAEGGGAGPDGLFVVNSGVWSINENSKKRKHGEIDGEDEDGDASGDSLGPAPDSPSSESGDDNGSSALPLAEAMPIVRRIAAEMEAGLLIN